MEPKEHWDAIYKAKAPNEVSWFQERPYKSLELIQAARIGHERPLIDVGGGASMLVDHLLELKYRNLWVLDISAEALERTKSRIGRNSDAVRWIEGDITTTILPHHHFDLWHDRAVFHFLTSPQDRERYKQNLLSALKPDGHLIMATFASEGPPRCSGLDVVRYSPEALHRELGPDFLLLEGVNETHRTPSETQQQFTYCHFQRLS